MSVTSLLHFLATVAQKVTLSGAVEAWRQAALFHVNAAAAFAT